MKPAFTATMSCCFVSHDDFSESFSIKELDLCPVLISILSIIERTDHVAEFD